jgi:hypothetical protein
MKCSSIGTGLSASLLATILATGTAGAQVRAMTTVQKAAPPMAQVLPAGSYTLVLHPSKKNNMPLNVPELDAQSSVTRSGTAMTLSPSNGPTLNGSVSGSTFEVSGVSGTGGSIQMNGSGATANGSNGTFETKSGPNMITGSFSLTLLTGPQPRAHKIANYGDPKPSSGSSGPPPCDFWCGLKQWFGL